MDSLTNDNRHTGRLTSNIVPVVLCGGSGKRLWPISRQSQPKQFQRLCSDRSLLQQTILRARTRTIPGMEAPLLLTAADHRYLVAEQLDEIGVKPLEVICEPAARNTAPALTAAAIWLHERDPDAIMLVMPSDHLIGDEAAFEAAVTLATGAAQQGWLCTFGATPTRPETGYGYIRVGAPLPGAEGVRKVSSFMEKPDKATAERLIDDGGHLWNCGIFLFPVAAFLNQVQALVPEIYAACESAVGQAAMDGNGVALDAHAFKTAPDISVDRAILERTDNVAVIEADMTWSDIGSWHALRDVQSADAHGNVVQGKTLLDNVTNSYVHGNGRLVAAVGLDDIVVVDTDDAVLISNAKDTGRIDEIVRSLQQSGMAEGTTHKRVNRPWGTYETVEDGTRFQVKHIVVRPGCQLSLQMHHHRAEHWIVVGGTARITCGNDIRLLHENESVYIPAGTTHRLDNPGKIPMHLIEVQVGAYLGEDDIVRFEDKYGRV